MPGEVVCFTMDKRSTDMRVKVCMSVSHPQKLFQRLDFLFFKKTMMERMVEESEHEVR